MSNYRRSAKDYINKLFIVNLLKAKGYEVMLDSKTNLHADEKDDDYGQTKSYPYKVLARTETRAYIRATYLHSYSIFSSDINPLDRGETSLLKWQIFKQWLKGGRPVL